MRTIEDVDRRVRPAKPLHLASADSLAVIAQIYPIIDHAMAFGDTDHDGRNEVIIAYRNLDITPPYSCRILEEQGDNTYHEEYVGPYMDPYAVGDLDKDGKSEILGQIGDRLVVYESADPSTYPTVLTWTSPPLTNIIGYPTIGDTDRDGNMEIIHSVNTWGTSRLVIFENRGDNNFVQVFDAPTSGSQDGGRKVVADLDQDGLMEIAFCGTYGYLHIFESPSDDVWQETFTEATGLDNAYAVAGGLDADGNGKPELFVTGDKYVPELGYSVRNTYVYEATSDNHFSRVATFTYDDQHRGGLKSVVADIDGDARPEYVLGVVRRLLVYRGIAPGEWTMSVGAIDPNVDGKHNDVHAFDVNRNGRAEIFWATSAQTLSTLVLEYQPAPTVPVLVNDLHAEVLPERVRLTWSLASGSASLAGVDVERAATPQGPYARLTPRVLEPSASMEYEDPGVEPGVDYWYRVVLIEPDGTRSFSSPVGVSFTGWPGETVLRAPSQPSRDLVQFRYTIGGPEVAVKLQIFDAAGRLLVTLDQGALGRGDYVQPWGRLDASGRTVARGLYIARLLAGQERSTRKFLLAR